MTTRKTPTRRYVRNTGGPSFIPLLIVLLSVVFMLYYVETRINGLASKINVMQSELDEAKRHQADMDSRYHLRKPK